MYQFLVHNYNYKFLGTSTSTVWKTQTNWQTSVTTVTATRNTLQSMNSFIKIIFYSSFCQCFRKRDGQGCVIVTVTSTTTLSSSTTITKTVTPCVVTKTPLATPTVTGK